MFDLVLALFTHLQEQKTYKWLATTTQHTYPHHYSNNNLTNLQVNISLRILSRPEEDKVPLIYKTLGTDFDERVLPSLGNEVLKSVVAQYNAEELLSKRDLVSAKIRSALLERSAKFNIILDDVSITNLTFGKEFAKAIEHKQVAQQEAETQAYLVAKVSTCSYICVYDRIKSQQSV